MLKVMNIFCDYWELYFEEDGTIMASLMFSFDYETKTGEIENEPYNGFTLYFQNKKEIKREWGLLGLWKNHEELKEKVMEKLNEKKMFKTLEKALTHLPSFTEHDQIIDGDETIPSYNPEAIEFWFEIKNIPAEFKMLYANSGSVINNRMILDEFPENHVLLHVKDHFLEYFKEKSKKRLYFLYQ
jgi:hypothetical protein